MSGGGYSYVIWDTWGAGDALAVFDRKYLAKQWLRSQHEDVLCDFKVIRFNTNKHYANQVTIDAAAFLEED